MSADNGIYILRTIAPPIKEGNRYINQHGKFEYRVAHCQAIDNIDYSDLYLPIYFGDSEIYHNREAAYEQAVKLAEDCEILEYGISSIAKEINFPNLTRETARKALDCYVGAIPV